MKCKYCKGKAVKVMVCNDWGNIPLCSKKECFEKFNKENVSQYFEEKV